MRGPRMLACLRYPLVQSEPIAQLPCQPHSCLAIQDDASRKTRYKYFLLACDVGRSVKALSFACLSTRNQTTTLPTESTSCYPKTMAPEKRRTYSTVNGQRVSLMPTRIQGRRAGQQVHQRLFLTAYCEPTKLPHT